ncbi:MAG: hypothetical protein EAZ70_03515 [Runella slithyformis]|nr:MAG: hypothetical protein EAY79_03095 [Runella slithyformis]TAF97184.1 MAG: hypothetical protein EAZ46_02870 [Runella sp.]TAG21912.1 MAG: hypothetical protein EAZ38_06910 [Cytophagales bacterium]TAG41144.1 MAG: hypothetical protein EAZ32_04015 [Cytophagia bacterium]TAF28997.1 MAG: hypothetical protein EAZ70_03515 [Runella slithyformis]
MIFECFYVHYKPAFRFHYNLNLNAGGEVLFLKIPPKVTEIVLLIEFGCTIYHSVQIIRTVSLPFTYF